MAEFDLSKLMKDVSELDTKREALRYILPELIIPDENNGYSMNGLDDLARSIEIIGLQQPLRVTETDDNKFRIISGHRRFAAISRLIENGCERFKDGIPCIVDSAAASEALRELQLLLGNADNRRMTSADESQQAERISDCIRKLEDEGYVFPGRHRDWVSKLSGMSRTKLARLNAISSRLEPKIKAAYYDTAKISEDAAYSLSKMPKERQVATVEFFKSKEKNPKYWYSVRIDNYGQDLVNVSKLKCKANGDEPCSNQDGIIKKIWASEYRGFCHCSYKGKCCADCPDLASCGNVCSEMKVKAAELKKEKREAAKRDKEAQAAAELPDIEQIMKVWFRFGDALRRANIEDADLRKEVGCNLYAFSKDQITKLEAGEPDFKARANSPLPFGNSLYIWDYKKMIGIAESLGCSLDYLFLRTDNPEVLAAGAAPVSESDTVAKWFTDPVPPADGRYFCRVVIDDFGKVTEQRCEWQFGKWYAYGNPLHEQFKVVGWWPLPPKEVE